MTRRLCGFTLLLLLCAAASSTAQPLPEGKRFEMSLSGGYQSFSAGSGSSSSSIFYISPRLGFFLVEGLELEPEFSGIFVGGGDPGYMVNGNLAYNTRLQGKALGFLLAGYGAANRVPVGGTLSGYYRTTLGVLNLGAGIKVLLSDDIAIRTELRYQRFTGSRTDDFSWGGVGGSQEYDLRLLSFQFGISIFP